MKRTLNRLLTAALLMAMVWTPPAPLSADVPPEVKFATLASSFDLDGEAADADQVVTVATLADSTSFTVAADPDTCRLVDATVVDADSSITVGTLTIDGFDCWGYPLRVTYNMAGGSGIRTGTVIAAGTANTIKASGAYFSDVTTVVSGALTGESGGADTLTVGYTTNSPKGWVMYGTEGRSTGGTRRFVDIFGKYDVNCLVTNGAATTDVVGVSASTTACFTNVSVGDLIIFNVGGDNVVRRVATRADADTITISTALTLPAAGLNFSYRKRYFSSDPIDGWISVQGYRAISFMVEVDANADTGGVVSSIECASAMSSDGPSREVLAEVDTDTVATGSTGFAATSIILTELPHYTHCRAGLKFGTGDDADTANEDIDVTVALTR